MCGISSGCLQPRRRCWAQCKPTRCSGRQFWGLLLPALSRSSPLLCAEQHLSSRSKRILFGTCILVLFYYLPFQPWYPFFLFVRKKTQTRSHLALLWVSQNLAERRSPIFGAEIPPLGRLKPPGAGQGRAAELTLQRRASPGLLAPPPLPVWFPKPFPGAARKMLLNFLSPCVGLTASGLFVVACGSPSCPEGLWIRRGLDGAFLPPRWVGGVLAWGHLGIALVVRGAARSRAAEGRRLQRSLEGWKNVTVQKNPQFT